MAEHLGFYGARRLCRSFKACISHRPRSALAAIGFLFRDADALSSASSLGGAVLLFGEFPVQRSAGLCRDGRALIGWLWWELASAGDRGVSVCLAASGHHQGASGREPLPWRGRTRSRRWRGRKTSGPVVTLSTGFRSCRRVVQGSGAGIDPPPGARPCRRRLAMEAAIARRFPRSYSPIPGAAGGVAQPSALDACRTLADIFGVRGAAAPTTRVTPCPSRSAD